MGLKYSQVKEIYKRANWLFYDNLYDERSLARDMITAAQQSARLTALRRGLAVSIFINVILLVVALIVILLAGIL